MYYKSGGYFWSNARFNLSGRDSEDSSFKAIQGRQGHEANFAGT